MAMRAHGTSFVNLRLQLPMPFLSTSPARTTFSTLADEAKRRVQTGESHTFLYLVPNRIAQRRMERELVEAAKGRTIAEPHILTLADFAGVLCEEGFPKLKLLSDAETGVLVEQAIRSLISEHRLSYFERATDEESGVSDTASFPIPRGTFELVVNTIRQLKESGVTTEHIRRDLKRSLELHGESTEVRRATDILEIYDAYMSKLIDNGFMDTYGQTLLLNERYGDTRQATARATSDFRARFSGVTDIFIDGFYHLEGPSMDLLTVVSGVTGVRTTIHLDSMDQNPALFSEVIKLIAELEEHGFHAVSGASATEGANQQDGYRALLRRHLFAGREPAFERQPARAVKLWSARNPTEEVEEIARKIKLVCEEDPTVLSDLSRIVVATPNAESYTPLFEEAFRRNEIPVQIADRHHLDRSPLVLSLLALFDIARFGLRRREVIRVLGSPYFNFTHPDGAQLDAPNLLDIFARYKLSGDLRGWKRSLNAHLSIIKLQQEQSQDNLQHAHFGREEERIGKAILDLDHLKQLLLPLQEALTPATFCNAVRELLSALEVQKCILSQNAHTIRAATLELDVRAYRELLKLLRDLDSLLTLMGDAQKERPLSYYIERFKAAVIFVRYSPRPCSGAVLVTSLAQCIAQPVDYLFIAGLTEGALPSVYQPQVFLMEGMQRGEHRQLMEDRVLFYQSVTNFQRGLYLSYPKKTSSNAEFSRSIFLDSLEEIVTIDEVKPAEGVFSYRDLFQRVGALAASEPQRLAEVVEAVEAIAPGSHYGKTLRDHVPRALRVQEVRRQPELSIYRGLVDSEMLSERERAALERNRSRVWSVTQLELYAGCPFKYFSKYILGLREEGEVEDGLDARERGNVLHEVLREFLTHRRERKLPSLQSIPEQEVIEAYAEARSIADRHLSAISNDHPFWRLDAESLMETKQERNVLWKFIQRERSLVKNEQRPRYFEASFGGAGRAMHGAAPKTNDNELSRDEPVVVGGIKLRGKIDRIDLSDDTFTIIDYKSGKQTASYADMERGISLQLPLYLRVAEDLLRSHFPELKGVAALYHKVLDKDSVREPGLAVRTYMGTAFEQIGNGKRKGILNSEEELEQLIERTVQMAQSYVEGISTGVFRLTERDLLKNCQYCPYNRVCRVAEAEEFDVLI